MKMNSKRIFKSYDELKKALPNVQWSNAYDSMRIMGVDFTTNEVYMLNGTDIVQGKYIPILLQ